MTTGPLRGRAQAPGDKSVSLRALILGAMAVGETEVSGLLEADDVLKLDRTHRHAEALGGSIDQCERHAFFDRADGFAEVRHQHAIDEESR